MNCQSKSKEFYTTFKCVEIATKKNNSNYICSTFKW